MTTDRNTLYATVMAGGAGTRFWPASRRLQPKQLLKLTGDRSMIQATVDRLSGLCSPENFLILTNQTLVDPIAVQLPEVPRASIVGEPAKRDTAPCIGLAAALVSARDPNATMVVMPADHVIGPVDVFQKAIARAADLVEEDPSRIITFGIRPTYPAEVFGYIERSASRVGDGAMGAWKVAQFREKPDRETAEKFLDAGSFYWNSGIFVWKARTILDALQQFEPEMAARIQAIADAVGTDQFDEVLHHEFCAIQGKSIDFAVMEHYDNVAMMEAPFQWDDLGNWSALPRLNGADDQGNTVQGRFLGIETTNTIVQNQSDGKHLVVALGMDNCIIVHTPDATLVADRDQEATVKQIVSQLENLEWNEFL